MRSSQICRWLVLWTLGICVSLECLCRYSVRDVGFVNVHGNAWQLRIVRPPAFDGDQVSQWETMLRTRLADTNVTYQWVPPDSQTGKKLLRLFEIETDLSSPVAAIFGADETVLPVTIGKTPTPDELDQMLSSVIKSPAREAVLNQISSVLCVILVVECGDEKLDLQATTAADGAAGRITKQMWMMDKPTKNGPVVFRVRANQKDQEQWMLRSLGIDPKLSMPSVAVIYGQGRCLGIPLTGSEWSQSKIVQLASLCGRSCECD